MKKKIEENDSDSDWDSMSEMRPPPRTDMSVDAQETLTCKPQLTSESDPPYSFRSEVDETRRSRAPRAPGKKSKGDRYDPPSQEESGKVEAPLIGEEESSQREPTNFSRGSGDPASYQNREPEIEDRRSESPQRPRGRVPRVLSPIVKLRDGVENEAYLSDDEATRNVRQDRKAKKEAIGLPAGINKNRRPEGDRSVTFREDLVISAKTKADAKEEKLLFQETSHSTPVSSLSPHDGPLMSLNQKMDGVCKIIALPFSVLSIFLHHLIKFVLLSIVKPLVLDTLATINIYLLVPLIKDVFQPLFRSIVVTVEVLSNMLTVLLMPLVQLISAVRLVEVNINKDRNTYAV